MLFDPDTFCNLSQDDKARVPLGLPIFKKQTALVMHVDYKVCIISSGLGEILPNNFGLLNFFC